MSNQTFVPDDLAVTLTDYEILAELGRGGVSVVYRARERELERDVAIKVVRNRFLEDTEAMARVDREARTLAHLHHPNIVTLLGARRLGDGRLALVMELAQGTTLRTVLSQWGPLTAEQTVHVLRQLASALSYIHQRGIVHRDVKPENIFMEDDGRILLSDLGIAKANDVPMDVTLTGVIVGTPAYMSPEQVDGSPLDGRSDQYSLGLVGYELLTGKKPWDGENLYSVIFKQKTQMLPPLEQMRPEVPDYLREVLQRAMQKNRDDRWGSMEEFIERLAPRTAPAVHGIEIARPEAPAESVPVPAPEAAAQEIGNHADPVTPVEPPRRRRGGGRRAAIAAGGVLVVGAVFVAAWMTGSDPGPGMVAPDPVAISEAGPAEPTRAEAPGPAPTGTVAGRSSGAATPAAAGTAPLRRADGRPAAARPAEPAPITIPPTAVAAASPSSGRISGPTEIPQPRMAPGVTTVQAVAAASPAISFAPVAVPASRYVAPQPQNMAAVGSLIAADYPASLAARNVGGTVTLSLSIDEQGRVTGSEVASSSGHGELDAVALRVARRMRFSPAERNGVPVTAQVQIPLIIQP